MLIDDVMPVYDVSDTVAAVVDADPAVCWAALMAVDLIDVGRKRPLVATLGALRMLPEIVTRLLRGELPPRQPTHLLLRDLATLPPDRGGWLLIGERDREEIAFGLIGQFWRPVIEYAHVSTLAEFRAFDRPGFAKTVYALSVQGIAHGRSLVSGVMRTGTTDAHARRWFRRYWTLGVGSGAHLLVHGLLDVTREMAEHAEIPQA
ncbi:MAG: hypothetical protein R2745_23275 [Vicinamibacterales bacterium]